MQKYSIGIDYGSESGRVVIVSQQNGNIIGTHVVPYKDGVITDKLVNSTIKLPRNYALQNPQDYLQVLYEGIPSALKKTKISSSDIVGIGVAFTSSTVIATDSQLQPLCFSNKCKDNPHSWVKLWKHLGAKEEAEIIRDVAVEYFPNILKSYGNHVSPEWLLPKCLEVLHDDTHFFNEVDLFLEAGDWIVSILTGKITRSNCSLGFKAFWDEKNGFNKKFLKLIHPKFEDLSNTKLRGKVVKIGEVAGFITKEMALKLNLEEGTPVGVSIIDAHASLLGIGAFKDKELTMVMGTSTCHLMLNKKKYDVNGISGVVKDAIVPELYAYEAGQTAVGDLFGSFNKQLPASFKDEAEKRGITTFQLLEEKAKELPPGGNGLVSLDWFNGNRSILSNYNVSGLMIGLTLSTKPEEMYLSLLEATAFGAKIIIENYIASGLEIDNVFACGGLPKKNGLLMQIYADVLNKNIYVSSTENASAVGAAILGAIASGEFGSYNEAIENMKQPFHMTYKPSKERASRYFNLYKLYLQLHNYFGKENTSIMKELKKI